jgi:hypothetical protein
LQTNKQQTNQAAAAFFLKKNVFWNEAPLGSWPWQPQIRKKNNKGGVVVRCLINETGAVILRA